MPAGRLRARDLRAPIRGIRMPATATTLEQTCAAIALALPASAVFSHDTAAALWGLPLPSCADTRLHITTPTGVRARRGPNIIGHQRALGAVDVSSVGGIRVTSPGRTFVDLADRLTLAQLVAVGDAIARRWGIECLEDAVARVVSTRRIRLLREALGHIDPAAESPKESELRVLLTDAGIGPLRANQNVYDGRGVFIARVDLALAALKIAIEYEGDHHRDKDQWRKDMARRRRLEAAGWIYIPVTQADLRSPGPLLADIRAAIARRA